MTVPRRRAILIGLVAPSLLFAGCGFELKRPPELHFRSIQLVGFAPKSPLAAELRRNIDSSPGTLVVDSAAQAQVVFEVLNDTRERSVLASTSAGLVREIQLRTRLNFRLRTPAGKELIAPTEILLSRDLSFNEGIALAKQYEADYQFNAMQTDIVAQVIRRLAAVTSF